MKGCKTNSRVSAVMEAVQFSEVELHQERIENGVKQEDKNTLEAKKSEKNQRSVPFYKLFCFADWLDYVLMAVGTIGACAHGAAIPVFFIFFGRLIDAFGSNYNNPSFMAKEVSKYALCFVYLGLVVLGAAWLEVACWMQSGERQSARMRMKYLKAMLSQDVGYFDTDTTTGEIVNSISSDTILVQDAISEKAGNYIHYMARFFAGFAVGFSSVWQLTLVTLAVVPAIALAGGLYAVVMVGLTSRSQKAYTKAGEIAEEAISQIRTVYSFVGEAKAREQYSKALEMTMELGKRGGLAKGLGVGTTYGLLFGAWALLLWYAGTLVRHGITNGGQAFTTILNVVISGIALGQAAPNLTAFGKAKAAGYNILEMINRTPAIDRNNVEGRILENLQGQIVFQHVSFSYPSRPDVLIFQDFCLTILAGKTVAIVGSSGSGKSTVVSLIERFYDPVSGAVLLDGENIKNLQLRWLRGQIGLVNQEPALFATSLLENILYGKENAGMEEVEAAATAANAHHFIERLPDGYHTQVGERGVQLSGGQKQRIAIARAMLKNPTILLLDEATSALDASSEHTVQEALDRLMIGRTTVVVAHRLSTVRNVDMIAVLNQGKVVEIGTHNQLISKETGAYATLVRLQETAPSRQLDGAAHSRRMSRGSLSQRNFSFHSGMASENDSGSLCMDTERSQQLMSMHKPSTIRLLKLNFPEWHVAVLGSLGAIMAGVETPLFALAISQVLVIFYFPDKEYIKNEVRKYALIFSGATVVTILIYLLQHYFFGIMGERLTKRVREKMFAAILENEVGWFDYEENNSSLVSSRLASDATLVRAAVGDRMSTIIQNIALTVTSFIISFSLEWHVTLVILACFPLMIGAAIGEQLFLKGFGGNLGKAYSRASMVAGEAVGNIRTVAAFSAEEKVLDLFCRELDLPKKRTLVLGQLSGFGYGISQFFMFSSYGLALWYSSTLVRDNKTSFGNVIKAFMVLIMTAFGIAETLALAPDIVKGSRALSFIFEILDRKTAINPDDPRAQEVVSIKGEIELRHVEFAYPARPDVMVFHDLSLKVHAGRSLALVGTSGSGKSSVISLIARFYDPLRGKVMVDGKDIKRLKLRSLRRHIGLVQQEPALFATTIYNNILYGKDGATEAEIVEAAKAANAHNFISALPSGYQTEVGERGVQLSGGQKQRVAIARAVLKDPAILLLDEATSALDAESEKVVQGALDHLMRGRTTVVVAHRLSTVRNADTIAVLQEGLIIEQGRHLELMNKVNGAYVQLVSMQQQQQVR
ncbi:hypothetical protein O6H91_16G018900 [Diphasiastrum complanatum]|nr:hypothetical protein O6H91_16G018900 [Diphasiastrum complanatum]KAJ7526701.1 hypothetical protein O6H91_16G018900 [Diphasiastrum complanatum]